MESTLGPNLTDWGIVIAVFVVIIGVGVWASRSAGRNMQEFFLSGRHLPWWMLGVSMVATTFATDTPNLVTDIVRKHGVAGNWMWWAFLLTGMLTVFIYARLWRRSGVTTDLEFYELRYSGWAGRFLRVFRAVYLGLAFNVLAMSAVTLAAIKIGEVMLGLDAWTTVGFASVATLIFSTLGGFRGVIYTDFFLFVLAIGGAVAAAVYIVGLPEVGGLSKLLAHPEVAPKLAIVPDLGQAFRSGGAELEMMIAIFIVPLAVQWWNAWYPGAEPGGGGYIAQRMLAAKNENHAIRATFFFNLMHYALRPWPWILVALASLVVFPSLESLQQAFPGVSPDKLADDLAYPAMLTFLPHGLLGLVLASLMAAYISTISTHLNWGASYLVNDVYRRFLRPEASDRELVTAGRLSTALLLVCGSLSAMYMTSATQIFTILLMFGAGTGLLFILRWFWWRINAWSEVAAMLTSGIISLLVTFTDLYPAGWSDWTRLPMVALLTTAVWLAVTFMTPPDRPERLFDFYQRIRPGGPGWRRIRAQMNAAGITPADAGQEWSVPRGILAMLIGTVFVYSALIATGYWIYGRNGMALVVTAVSIGCGIGLLRLVRRTGSV